MTRFTTLALLLLTFGTATLAQEQPERLFFQAEAMTPEGDAWSVKEHFRSWYTGVPLGEMLDGSKGGLGQAAHTLNVPTNGRWKLWVRYIDYTSYRGAFRVTVLQGEKVCGQKLFDKTSLRADEAGRKKWGDGFGEFVWDFLEADLDAAPTKVVVSKEEPLSDTWLIRKLDCFALVTGLAYVPSEVDFVAPLWVRVILDQAHPQPSAISVWGKRPFPPVWYPPYNQLGREGLEERHYPRETSFLAPGEHSPWVNIAPLLTTRGQNNMRFMAMVRYPEPLEGADLELLFASEPSDSAIFKRFKRAGPGAGIFVTIDLTRRDEIRSEVAWSQDALAAARAVPVPVGRRARRFPLLTGLSVSADISTKETLENELEVMTRLGISGMAADQTLLERGFVRPFSHSFYFHLREEGCFSRPKREDIRTQLMKDAKKLAADEMTQNLAWFSLMDEPESTSLAHLTDCGHCKGAFRMFLRDREGLSPKDLNRETWEQVALTTDQKEAPLYYWTARFRHQVLADFFKLGTDVLREVIPDIRTTVNYAEELTYQGNLLARGVDWFLIQNQEALTYGWNEDWCNFSVSEQLSGYHASFLGSACRTRGQPFGMYTIISERLPWDIQTKTIGKIGHGAKAIHYFNYGPAYAISSDQCSQRQDIYPALTKVNHAIGAVEDYIMDGHIPTGRVALLYSHSSDIWTQEESTSLHGKERQNIWLLLRHLGYTPQIITETEVKVGALSGYDLVFVHGAHLETNAAAALIDWVKQGGTLYLGAGSAQFNHYHQPLEFDQRLGISRGAFTLTQLPGTQDTNHLPTLKVLATAKVGDQTVEAICALHELSAWEGAKALLNFTDQKPAILAGPCQKGRIIAAGFFPGLTYAREGVAEKAKRNPAITSNPPAYPAGCRRLFTEMLGKTTPRDPVTTSHYLVEAGLLTSQHGLLVTLANWSGSPVTNLEVRVRGSADLREPVALLAPLKSVARRDGELVLTLDIAEFELITLPQK
ncbi:MAG: hypothetical protein PHO37_06160 [Kiritimatiellae bacterium]|nr:hypothetical protein [Kiritimatiellia bacterium]